MRDSLLNLVPRLVANTANPLIGWRSGAKINSDEFIARVTSWRALLEPLPDQQFALYLDDSIEFSAALLGAWHAGKTIWLAADTLASTTIALKRTVDGFLGEFPADCLPIKPSHFGEAADYVPLDDQFIGLVVHTSGTTGAPQAIPKKLSQLATEIATLGNLFGKTCANAEVIATVSHQHIYGLLFKALWPLCTGRPIHARSQLFPEELAQFIWTRPSVLISSPAYLKRLPTHLKWAGNTPCLRAVFSSGGVLPEETARLSASLLGQSPIEIFGSSETGGIAWRQRGEQKDESWTPMPGVLWRQFPEDELMEVRSPHLISTEWFRLSDRIQESKNGRFILKGRRDRIVKIEEKRISLDAIEQRIATCPLVSEVKVVVIDEADGQIKRQQLGAVVVLSEHGKSVLAGEGKHALNCLLKECLVNFVEPIAAPRRWRYVDEFPMDLQGKSPQAGLLELFKAVNENSIEQTENKVVTPIVKLLNRNENCVEFELVWPQDILYFEGHFPGTPILPGVAQIDWAIKTGRRFFDLPAHFRALHALKFQHVILPDSPVKLTLNYDQEKGCLSFTYFSSTKQHASGRILFSFAV